MTMTPIQPSATSQIQLSIQPGVDPAKLKNKVLSTPMHRALANNPILQKHPGLSRDLMRLAQIKQKISRIRRGRGPKRGRRARRRRLERRMHQLMRRIRHRLIRLINGHRTQRTQQSQAAQKGADFSFLNDPNMSMSDKIEQFLQTIIKDSEAKMEELMQKQADQSKSQTAGSKLLGFAKKVGTVAGGIFGGPVGAAVANMAGGAIGNAVSSSGGQSESDQRMTMFKIQKLQDHVQQMFQFFSTKTKKEADLISGIIRNMA